ncbi:MAG: deoxyribodipyrimidine photo-lyase [Melioribacteraceae bacterium]|nr:deoxyribodipyrimidine photo-lyase [Melioribacteraceae bacterium]
MHNKRLNILKDGSIKKGTVVYWMQRDQRVKDNWALFYAYKRAKETNQNLIVIFNLVPSFLNATIRQYYFMIEGLKEVEKNLHELNIQFILLKGNPADTVPEFVNNNNVSLLVSDFNPLKKIQTWKNKVIEKIDIPFHEIDAHNIIPVWVASDKAEFAAYTIRPKINKLLPEFLDQYPQLEKMESNIAIDYEIKWSSIYNQLQVDETVYPIDKLIPGESAANELLKDFIEKKIQDYSQNRNDPNMEALSNISPYLHFGHISAQRIALILNDFSENDESVSTYLEELIVRRELADNFCYYNEDYDNFNGFHDWAKKSLNEHRNDKRDYIYSLSEFESASTHDELWNAAQTEMVTTGKMHGFMRMYWAKKILEWTESPEQALEFGIYLNDKYELDGRDPNGYVGLAWSIGGVHDRAWTERSVYGKIRYMNYNGCKRKFDVNRYINRFRNEIK